MVGFMPKENPNKDLLFDLSLQMLQDIYDIAKMKQDTETMTSVSDRICLLYEKQVDIEMDKKSPLGFKLKEDDDE